MSVVIAPLEEHEIGAICSLAKDIWRRHYPSIIGEAQTEYMLRQRYDAELIRDELRGGRIWWDVLRVDGALVAFASSMPSTDDRELKLDKLYVDSARQRSGYGGMLIAHTCARACELGYAAVVLAVNKRNSKAIAAYRKYGFEVREAVVKDIGGGFVMDDYIMSKALEPTAAHRAATA